MQNFEISSISIHAGKMPVSAHFSYGSTDTFPFIIVKINADQFQGLGETLAKPCDSFQHMARRIIGQDVRRLDELLPAWNSEHQRRFCEAMSMALYDLLGKMTNLPAWSLLGGKKRDKIPVMPCIFPENPKQAAQLAENFISQGCKHLKTKLIGNINEDTARIKAIKKACPEIIHLQGDANEGYTTIERAVDAVMRLGDAGLDFFEDPLKGNIDAYCQLRQRCKKSKAKVTVDLMARSLDSLSTVLQRQAADAISLHPCQMGSLSCAITHVQLVQSHSLPVILAGTGFTGVGAAAWQHLTAAATLESPTGEPGGPVDHSMPESTVQNLAEISNGHITLPNTPGLGIEVNEKVLQKYQILETLQLT